MSKFAREPDKGLVNILTERLACALYAEISEQNTEMLTKFVRFNS
jgi:hypothetical protein